MIAEASALADLCVQSGVGKTNQSFPALRTVSLVAGELALSMCSLEYTVVFVSKCQSSC